MFLSLSEDWIAFTMNFVSQSECRGKMFVATARIYLHVVR